MRPTTLYSRYGLSAPRFMIAAAPMAGVSDLPFRQLCEQLGADFSVTEMTATAPQLLQTNKNQSRLHFTANARVNICQIVGNDARQMATAAINYAKQGADIIDINLGCPAKKINRKGAGSALLSDLSRVKNIVQAVTAACPVPVTIKTRLGPNHQCYTLPALAEIDSQKLPDSNNAFLSLLLSLTGILPVLSRQSLCGNKPAATALWWDAEQSANLGYLLS